MTVQIDNETVVDDVINTTDVTDVTDVTDDQTELSPLPERCIIEVRAIGSSIEELEANALSEAVTFAGTGRFVDPEIIRTYQIKPLSPLFVPGGGYYAYVKISFTAAPQVIPSPRHGTEPDHETGDDDTSRSVGRRRRRVQHAEASDG